MIFLGSSLDLLASEEYQGPQFDIFKTNVDRSYRVTDHLKVNINQGGTIELTLSQYLFTIDINESRKELQQITNYPDLQSNNWTKEWKSSDLPIFCRAEHLIQKQSGIAFRFRLGSVDYVNALEGK